MKIIVVNCETVEKSLEIFNFYKDLEQKGLFRLMFLGTIHEQIPKWQQYPHLTYYSNDYIRDELNVTVIDKFLEKYIITIDSYYDEKTSLPIDFEIVVAKYREDISWLYTYYLHNTTLTQYIKRCHVYDKGGETIPYYNVWRWEKIKNVGREAHTYLKHIIDNYNNLSEVTLFTQGNIKDHGACANDLYECVKNAQKNGFDQLVINVKPEMYSNWGMMNHTGKWLEEKKSGNMRLAKLTFGEFYEAIMEHKHPDSIKIYYAAIFAVRKDVIQKHPLSKYIQMIEFVDDHINPEEGHYFERLWNIFWTS